ncbi:hypothetical protein [Priestia aryabhattai]|jgi:hypothetical protein|uniref:hypothetical protein n=1 Tax=Priestia aryabhattai TaxID=412384 RepID=UPI0037357CE9
MFESTFFAELSKRVGTLLIEVQTDGNELFQGILARVSGDVLVVVPVGTYPVNSNLIYIQIPSINFVKFLPF